MPTHIQHAEETVSLPLAADLLNQLSSFAGAIVQVELRHGQLVLHRSRRRPTLDDLLDQCDPNAPVSEEDVAWDGMRPVGRELL